MEEKTCSRIILSHHLTILQQKYVRMSVLELKKQRIKLITDLKSIHETINQIIHEKNAEAIQYAKKNPLEKHEDLDEQFKLTKKIQQNLKKSLNNFEYMLTNEYGEKVQQQINNAKYTMKNLRQEVSLLNRQMELPMERDIKICDKLSKQILSLEQQIQELRGKNRQKKERITDIQIQNTQKTKKLNSMRKSIREIQQNEQFGEYTKKQTLAKRFKQVNNQKSRLSSLIQKIERKNKQQFKKSTKNMKQVDETSEQIQYYLIEIEDHLQVTDEQIKNKNAKIRSLRKKNKANSKRNRYYTESAEDHKKYPEYSRMKKRQQSFISDLDHSNARKMSTKQQQSFRRSTQADINDNKQINSNSSLFPNIYQILGKKKLLVEQDCDIEYLVYQGNS